MAEQKEKKLHIHVVKRDKITKKNSYIIRVMAIAAALVLVSLLLLALGHNPLAVYEEMWYGAFGKEIFVNETIKQTIPLLVTSMGIALAFKMKLWNIGGEGQILIGGAAAMAVAIYTDGMFGLEVNLLLMGIAAAIAAGLYGLIPAFFKAKWNTNETLLTLMLNYIAQKFIILLQNTKSWQRPGSSFPKIRMLTLDYRLPKIGGVHMGWIIALVLVVLFTIYTRKTKQGFELKVTGDSQNTANYVGINVKKVIMRTFFISAALCGIAGFMQVAGADGSLSEATSKGMGFTAITVAWMAKMNPVAMIIVSTFISFLSRGSSRIQTTFSIPASLAEVITGILILFMVGCEFFMQYKIVARKQSK